MSAFKRIFGYKPKDLYGFVKARLLHDLERHYKEGDPNPGDTVLDDIANSIIERWTNEDLLLAISFALIDMKKARKIV